jgi:hypothetical protein
LLSKSATPVDLVPGGVVYEMDGKQFVNGDPDKNPDYISSQEIHACKDKVMLVDQQALDLRKQHNGRFV